MLNLIINFFRCNNNYLMIQNFSKFYISTKFSLYIYIYIYIYIYKENIVEFINYRMEFRHIKKIHIKIKIRKYF